MSKLFGQLILNCTTIATFLVIAGQSQAGIVLPTSYDMPNGDGTAHGGTLNYWDGNYTGSGSTTTDGLSGSFLSGGLGALTDGVTTTQNWYLVSNTAGTGPYVGWENDPTITFHFATVQSFSSVDIHFDFSGIGGVSAPASVIINGDTTNLVPPLIGLSAPAWVSFDVSSLSPTDILSVTLNRNDPSTYNWVFADEFQFSNGPAPVPEPSTAVMASIIFGIFGVVWSYRRLKRSSMGSLSSPGIEGIRQVVGS